MDDRIRYNREEVQCIWEDLFTNFVFKTLRNHRHNASWTCSEGDARLRYYELRMTLCLPFTITCYSAILIC